MADLSARDVERGKFAFGIYDFDGNDTVDGFYLGDCLRALNLNPTQASIEKLGGTAKKGEKKFKLDEFLPIFSQVKKDKDMGTYEDFMECMKLYDKSENGTMIGAELYHILVSLGERLTEQEADDIIKDCCDPEDEDGLIPYSPFLKRLIAGHYPESK
jgi:Ca2+-binding EF-hand superfamily protein